MDKGREANVLDKANIYQERNYPETCTSIVLKQPFFCDQARCEFTWKRKKSWLIFEHKFVCSINFWIIRKLECNSRYIVKC